eukprot:Hpha_TRINITY_DN11431_c0_g1::TRINITY_DN11431_c0_g1_i4::g.137349::m.137349
MECESDWVYKVVEDIACARGWDEKSRGQVAKKLCSSGAKTPAELWAHLSKPEQFNGRLRSLGMTGLRIESMLQIMTVLQAMVRGEPVAFVVANRPTSKAVILDSMESQVRSPRQSDQEQETSKDELSKYEEEPSKYEEEPSKYEEEPSKHEPAIVSKTIHRLHDPLIKVLENRDNLGLGDDSFESDERLEQAMPEYVRKFVPGFKQSQIRIVMVPLCHLYFYQNSIRSQFENGMLVTETMAMLQKNADRLYEIPLINVQLVYCNREDRVRMYSLNNRRLTCFHQVWGKTDPHKLIPCLWDGTCTLYGYSGGLPQGDDFNVPVTGGLALGSKLVLVVSRSKIGGDIDLNHLRNQWDLKRQPIVKKGLEIWEGDTMLWNPRKG